MPEIIDILNEKNRIIQKQNGFKYNIDSVLLADFIDARGESLIDLGTGTGIIPILVEEKNNFKNIIGIEIQEDYVDMAKRSVHMNNQEETINIIHCDIMKIKESFNSGIFDAVCSNPPYFVKDNNLVSPNTQKSIARNEILVSLEGLIESASFLLKNKASFFMVHRPDRLTQITRLLLNNNLEIKKMRFIYPRVNKDANLVLIEAKKNAGIELKVLPPLYVYDKEGYSKEIKKIYKEVNIEK